MVDEPASPRKGRMRLRHRCFRRSLSSCLRSRFRTFASARLVLAGRGGGGSGIGDAVPAAPNDPDSGVEVRGPSTKYPTEPHPVQVEICWTFCAAALWMIAPGRPPVMNPSPEGPFAFAACFGRTHECPQLRHVRRTMACSCCRRLFILTSGFQPSLYQRLLESCS
jgi:hypothetical protein